MIAERVIAEAQKRLGIPYVWGGTNGPADPGPDGFDCSGLTQEIADAVGFKLPRTAAEQLSYFRSKGWSVSLSDLRPGDFVYLTSSGPSGRHAGIYLGAGKFINAPFTGARVRVDTLDAGKLLGAGRLPGSTSPGEALAGAALGGAALGGAAALNPWESLVDSLEGAFPGGWASIGLTLFGVLFVAIAAWALVANSTGAELADGIGEALKEEG